MYAATLTVRKYRKDKILQGRFLASQLLVLCISKTTSYESVGDFTHIHI